jgi:uncharacterized membrane protein
MAGLFFTFSTFVTKALSRLPPGEGMAAMQAINSAILNPLFFTLFFGTVAVCLWAVVASLLRWHQSGGRRLWSSYLTNWTAWNHVRTVASLAAAALLTLALA